MVTSYTLLDHASLILPSWICMKTMPLRRHLPCCHGHSADHQTTDVTPKHSIGFLNCTRSVTLWHSAWWDRRTQGALSSMWRASACLFPCYICTWHLSSSCLLCMHALSHAFMYHCRSPNLSLSCRPSFPRHLSWYSSAICLLDSGPFGQLLTW